MDIIKIVYLLKNVKKREYVFILNKRFGRTGVCVSRKHYMIDISNKLEQIKNLIDNEFYFTINKS